jgi:cytochrome c biogenesis factor
MYTEISHFLLLHGISQEILHFFCLSILWLLRRPGNRVEYTKKLFHRGALAQVRLGMRARDRPISEALFSIELTHLILTGCFFGTISNYVCSDFSIYNILTNSTADVPLFYKISATWSNHEGSLLLWCWLLSLNAFLFCISLCNIQIKCFSSLVASFFFVAIHNYNSVARLSRFAQLPASRAYPVPANAPPRRSVSDRKLPLTRSEAERYAPSGGPPAEGGPPATARSVGALAGLARGRRVALVRFGSRL